MAEAESKTCFDFIDHIAVPTDDIDKTVAWYKQTFNCDVEYQDDTWAFLAFANIRLALVIPSQHPAHIAFAIGNAEQFGELQTHRDGTRSLYVKDPGGNSVELLDRDSVKRKP